jgi:hypothetical protein
VYHYGWIGIQERLRWCHAEDISVSIRARRNRGYDAAVPPEDWPDKDLTIRHQQAIYSLLGDRRINKPENQN